MKGGWRIQELAWLLSRLKSRVSAKQADEILKDERFKDEDKDILDFLFASDCDGKCSYKTAKKIYDLIKDVDFGGKIFTYTAYSDGKDYENFKEFLKECYQKHRTIIWY